MVVSLSKNSNNKDNMWLAGQICYHSEDFNLDCIIYFCFGYRSASNAEYRNRDRVQTSITLVCISAFFVICVTPDVSLFTKYSMTEYTTMHYFGIPRHSVNDSMILTEYFLKFH